jgi:hypothetical protein
MRLGQPRQALELDNSRSEFYTFSFNKNRRVASSATLLLYTSTLLLPQSTILLAKGKRISIKVPSFSVL